MSEEEFRILFPPHEIFDFAGTPETFQGADD
jgi:hypothetical protein